MAIRKFTAAALFATATMFTAPAQAQGLLDIGRIILGLPGADDDKPPIDYKERAPLVVPPNQNLRPPVEAAAPDQRRANWPQDPDVIARRKAAAENNKPRDLQSLIRPNEGPRRMTVDEIRAGRVAGAEIPREPQRPVNDSQSDNVYSGISTLRELDRASSAKAADNNLSRAEPPREYLTDPPSGVRRPADNAAFRATREGSLGVRQEASPYDIFQRQQNTR